MLKQETTLQVISSNSLINSTYNLSKEKCLKLLMIKCATATFCIQEENEKFLPICACQQKV